jgi:hypothetical protein
MRARVGWAYFRAYPALPTRPLRNNYAFFQHARVARPVDERDLKSFPGSRECGFKSIPRAILTFSMRARPMRV